MGISPTLLAHRVSQTADSQRLFSLLPEVGIAHTEPLSEAVLSQWPVDLCWSATHSFEHFSDLLTQLLAEPCSGEYLLHYLQKAGAKGETFNLYVDGRKLTDHQLLEMLPYLAVTANDQPVLRVLITLDDQQRVRPALKALTQRLFSPALQPMKRQRFAPLVGFVVVSLAVGAFWWNKPLWMPMDSSASVEISVTEPEPAALMVEPADSRLTEAMPQTVNETLVLPSQEAVAAAVSEVVQSLADQKSPLAEADEAEVKAFIQAWLKAWQEKDADRYLAAYQNSYSGYAHLNASQWQQNRREKFATVQQIQLALGPITIWREGDRVHARFWQLYRSSGYRDNTDKELVLLPQPEGWQIVDEINHKVIPLSADQD